MSKAAEAKPVLSPSSVPACSATPPAAAAGAAPTSAAATAPSEAREEERGKTAGTASTEGGTTPPHPPARAPAASASSSGPTAMGAEVATISKWTETNQGLVWQPPPLELPQFDGQDVAAGRPELGRFVRRLYHAATDCSFFALLRCVSPSGRVVGFWLGPDGRAEMAVAHDDGTRSWLPVDAAALKALQSVDGPPGDAEAAKAAWNALMDEKMVSLGAASSSEDEETRRRPQRAAAIAARARLSDRSAQVLAAGAGVVKPPSRKGTCDCPFWYYFSSWCFSLYLGSVPHHSLPAVPRFRLLFIKHLCLSAIAVLPHQAERAKSARTPTLPMTIPKFRRLLRRKRPRPRGGSPRSPRDR